MEALVKLKEGPGNIEIQDRPIPSLSEKEVLIKVKVCGICGSDIKMYHGNYKVYPPVIMGHEFSGEIIKLGRKVKDYQVGDRVVSEAHSRFCGICCFCRSGNIQLCPEKRPAGSGVDGGFAEYIKMPEFLLHRIPDNLSYEEAALAEPTAIAAQAVLVKASAGVEDLVVVVGCGPIGIQAVQIAKSAGSRVMITGVDGDDKRLNLAEELGTDWAVNVSKEDPVKKILELSRGYGADIVIECSGSASGIQEAIELVRRQGKIVASGLTGKETVPVPWDKAVFKDCRLEWHFSAQGATWDKVLALFASGRVKTGPLITEVMPLSEWKQAFRKMEKREAIKVLLMPGKQKR